MSVIAFKKQNEVALQSSTDLMKQIADGAAAEGGGDDHIGLRRPIIVGSLIVAIFIVGLGTWAALAPLSAAVIAAGVVKVEDSRKVVKNRDGGIVREVLVRDGQHVEKGDVLLRMDDVQARSAFEVFDNQLMNLMAQRARFTAEGLKLDRIEFPPALLERRADLEVSRLITDQTTLFETRRQGLATQVAILNQNLDQLNTRIGGYDAQVSSVSRQQELIDEEKAGVQTLLNKGLAPKTQVLALERASVNLGGQAGSLRSQIAEARQQQGEAQMQINRLYEDRLTEASQGLSEVQSEMANIVPRLQAARSTLDLTEVASPAAGTVLGLTQFTNGGVVGAGERILDIVPDNTQLIVEAMVNPQDIDDIQPGMAADVKLTAYSQNTPSVKGKVLRISADRLTMENGTAYYTADIEVEPSSLTMLAHDLRLYPGMPAEVIIPTTARTALDYLLSPITSSMDRAFREQ